MRDDTSWGWARSANKAIDYWNHRLRELDDAISVLCDCAERSKSEPRSQVRDNRDQWERGPVQSGVEATKRWSVATAPPIDTGRVEAMSGEERCEMWRAITKSSTTGRGGVIALSESVLARCIFRRGHEGRCAFQVEG